MATRFNYELLARARVDLGLTQEDAARAVGVDVRTYRRYESGEVNQRGEFEQRRASRRKVIAKMARELGVAEGELVVSDNDAISPAGGSLPRARHFVGRALELARLAEWLPSSASTARVLGIVAIGGAGKTSLVERALRAAEGSRPVVVHSFYDEPSVDVFFDAAIEALGESSAPGKESQEQTERKQQKERVERLVRALGRAPDAVLVLDGIEALQATGEAGRARGELQDARLLRLLRTVVRSSSLGRALVTSRFPIVDLAAFEGEGFETIALAALGADETALLLRKWGLSGSPKRFDEVHTKTGGHALSVAVTGSFAESFLDGDLERALDLDLADAARDVPLARRLRTLLDQYARELPALDRELLSHVSIFPRGVDEVVLHRIEPFRATDAFAVRASLGRLALRGLAVMVGGRVSAHPFIREHFRTYVPEAKAIHAQERARIIAELDAAPDTSRGRPEGSEWLDRLETLFDHTLLAGDGAAAHALLARSMGGFEHLGLRLGEFERGLRMVRALERLAQSLPARTKWRLAYDSGLYCAALGDLTGAMLAYEAMLATEEADETVHRTLAYMFRLAGDLSKAHAHVTRSLELSRAHGATPDELRALALRGAIFTVEGRLDDAKAAFDEARAAGDAPAARRGIWEAEAALARGDLGRAVDSLRDNVVYCEQRQWTGHVAHCRLVLGRAALLAGDAVAADRELGLAGSWCEREVELLLWSLLLETEIARALGDEGRARAASARGAEAARAGRYGLLTRMFDALDGSREIGTSARR